MPKCKNPTCKINQGICDTQHRCFTCGAYFHMMCSYTILVKDNGQEWESLQYPGNCFECNKKRSNQSISMKELKGRKEEDFESSNKSNVAEQSGQETKEKKETVFSPRRTRSERKKEESKNESKGDKNSLKDPDPTDKLEEVKTNEDY